MILSPQLMTYQQRIEPVLDRVLPTSHTIPSRLHEAMRYAVLNGGKRMRPMLVYATGQALGQDLEYLDHAAAAIELIHVYSLIHDDLPAMDNDDLRRGKPTCHRAYDEATAILAADALQALAFELLTYAQPTISAAQQLFMLRLLAQAAGSQGMVGGQAIDLAAVGKVLTEGELETMHRYKTGALIRASVGLGAQAAGCSETQRDALYHYAACIGLAFQVQDDILDIESDTVTLGKTQGADLMANKPTYPSIMGMAAAKQKLILLHNQALEALADFDERADSLREIAKFTVKRAH
ncbi:polyprenyl synthetase family protein [Thiofilum flexile]|uniref:polyprenyl synthetase family protein n=1 Tax=Thiofilum flexile TaxID=125627 RepID=UPI000375184D|nr:farnesyl diphosphate synthase [Thiofilum flexile]